MKLYVGNLSFSTTEETLQAEFGAHGQVEEVALMLRLLDHRAMHTIPTTAPNGTGQLTSLAPPTLSMRFEPTNTTLCFGLDFTFAASSWRPRK